MRIINNKIRGKNVKKTTNGRIKKNSFYINNNKNKNVGDIFFSLMEEEEEEEEKISRDENFKILKTNRKKK